jgi:hypothetical protein
MPRPKPKSIPSRVVELAHQLADPMPMRRGTLSVQYVKCGKPGCRCGERPEARHGPYASVVRTVGGKTRSQRAPAAKAEVLQRQVEAGQRFRQHIEQYWEACEQWADQELRAPEEAAIEKAEKKGSAKHSRKRSAPRSKRS